MDSTMVSLVEATEGAAGLCRPCPWPSGEAGEYGVVELTAAKEEAVDESTIGTVRAMGRVHNRKWGEIEAQA